MVISVILRIEEDDLIENDSSNVRKLVRKAPLKEQKPEITRRNQHEKALEKYSRQRGQLVQRPQGHKEST